MDNSNKIIPPHLNAEVYRSDTTGVTSVSYLEYIALHAESGVLIGCSELTSRYWNGGASIYSSVTEAQKNQNNAKTHITLTSGTADGCFVGSSSKILLCEDNGTVSVWSTTEQETWNIWQRVIGAAEHDNAVMAVDTIESEKEYVTAGADGNVKVWDINEMICVRNYLAAHTLSIYGVAVKPKSSNFATGSQDHYLTLWDDHVSKPVFDIAVNDCGIRCLQWLDDNQILFGDEAGILSLVDIRKAETITKLAEFPAAVHKIAIHSETSKVAVCCDNKIVSVCDITEELKANVIYHDRHMHSNYVRGVTWDPNDSKTLHTVGWDSEIKTHHIDW